ncbi:MAG: antibiotic biosynthesis monooxygenase family protein [Jatrophihabitantaceae bacterium]
MIIIAGTLRVAPVERDQYLAVVGEATRLARQAPGCLDFAQSPDPLESDRINIYERWESDEQLAAFRSLPGDGRSAPAILDADVRRFRISSVQAP